LIRRALEYLGIEIGEKKRSGSWGEEVTGEGGGNSMGYLMGKFSEQTKKVFVQMTGKLNLFLKSEAEHKK
jgi:hypothetical protein